VVQEEGKVQWFSVYTLVRSYETLFAGAVSEKGNLEPYLQQLANYDARQIAEFRSALCLSEDIAVKSLKSGVLQGMSEKDIKRKVHIFLTPERAKVHGRPIYAREARKCGLNVKLKDVKDEMWSLVYQLYVRLDNYVSTNDVAKCIESADYSFRAKVGRKREGEDEKKGR